MPSFPASPTNGQKYTSGSRSWVYASATKTWDLVQGPVAHKSTHATGGSDPLTPADIGAMSAASPTFTGTATVPTLKYNAYAIGNSGNAYTVNLANGSFQTITLTGTATISPYTGQFCTITLPDASAGAYLCLVCYHPDSTKRAQLYSFASLLQRVMADKAGRLTDAGSGGYTVIQCFHDGQFWCCTISGIMSNA